MSLRSDLTTKLTAAMKARDTLALDALRYLLSLVRNEEIEVKHELTDEELSKLLQTEVKKRRDAIEQFKTGGRTETVEEETKKLEVLLQFLPKQLSAEEVQTRVSSIVSGLPAKDFPTAMKVVMAELKGQADGRLISEAVKTAISV